MLAPGAGLGALEMVFNSLTFALFFAIVLALHALPFSWRTKKINLLVASYIFYAAWNPPFIIRLRPPSSPELRVREDGRLPRATGWDPLLATAGVAGVHFDDHPSMQGLDLPEWSHLSRACARVFTDAYVRALAAATPRLKLREPAPAPLGPDDC